MLTPKSIHTLRTIARLIQSPECPHGFNMRVMKSDIHHRRLPDHSAASHTCGTVMCIGGWANHLHTEAPKEFSSYSQLTDESDAPDLPCGSGAEHLFQPRSIPRHLWSTITAAQAAEAIERFIAAPASDPWSTT